MTSTQKKKMAKKENIVNNKNWLEIEHSNEIICYENNQNELNCRIEARLNQKKSWNIFKTYFDKKEFNFVEEYFADNSEEAIKIIDNLKKEESLSIKEIKSIQEEKNKVPTIKIQRMFKELDSEKWSIKINSEPIHNFFVINFEDQIYIDIIVFEKFKIFEDKIVKEIIETLNLEKFDIPTNTNIFYFTKRKQILKEKESQPQVMIGKIEMGFKPN